MGSGTGVSVGAGVFVGSCVGVYVGTARSVGVGAGVSVAAGTGVAVGSGSLAQACNAANAETAINKPAETTLLDKDDLWTITTFAHRHRTLVPVPVLSRALSYHLTIRGNAESASTHARFAVIRAIARTKSEDMAYLL